MGWGRGGEVYWVNLLVPPNLPNQSTHPPIPPPGHPQDVMPASCTSPRDRARRLAIANSHPTWLVSRWLRRFGEEATTALLKRNNERPVYALRANAAALDKEDDGGGGKAKGAGAPSPAERLLKVLGGIEGVAAQPSKLMPSEFVRLERGLQHVLRAGLLDRGLCAVQDESTGLVVQLLDPRPGEALLDCCAAPGNKTLLAAARMGEKVRVCKCRGAV